MGKNFIVGQSGGPTAVINASLAGVAAAALEHCRANGGVVYGMQHGIQGFARGEVVDLGAQLPDEAAIALLKTTPAAALGSCRRRLPAAADEPQVYEDIFRRLEELDIGYFFYIGGNDSMDTIQKLHDWGTEHGSAIRFVGVPKTIDNDLAMTDHTPGYGSAARYIATVMKELLCDSLVYDEKRVTVVEIMGRNAGWLAGAAALSADEECAGPDLLYLPETPFDVEGFIRRVEELQKVRKSVVVAISEGIRLDDGRYVCELSNTSASVDVFGHRQLSGAGNTLSAILSSRLGAKCRAVELSTMQRCAAHLASGTDVEEAFAAGAAGVKAALAGESGVMVTLVRAAGSEYSCSCATADIHAIANEEKTVPLAWIDVDNATVTQEFLDYARPLILGESAVVWQSGIPRHFVVK